jgi:hypothetical protein
MKTVEDVLRNAINFFEKRRKEYGEEYSKTGIIRKAFFPQGVELKTKEDFYFFHLFDMICMKLGRIAEHWINGQHLDSWNDIMVYAAMGIKKIENNPSPAKSSKTCFICSKPLQFNEQLSKGDGLVYCEKCKTLPIFLKEKDEQ